MRPGSGPDFFIGSPQDQDNKPRGVRFSGGRSLYRVLGELPEPKPTVFTNEAIFYVRYEVVSKMLFIHNTFNS